MHIYSSENKDKFKEFEGRHCLYKKEYSTEYKRISIIAVRNGIVKYRDFGSQGGEIVYSDAADMTPCDILENPFDEDDELYRIEFIGCEGEKAKDRATCSHDWMYMDYMSYPPIHGRECRKCGKSEHIPRNGKDWVDGQY